MPGGTRYGERRPAPGDHWVPEPGLKGGFRNCCDGTLVNGCKLIRAWWKHLNFAANYGMKTLTNDDDEGRKTC